MTSKEFALEMKRFIKSPPETVYAAWTDPARLKQWFGPEGVETNDLVAEARVGGIFRWDITDPEGDKMTMLGEFRELLPARKVVFTWQWQEDEAWENQISLVTVELSPCDGGTNLRLIHEQLPNARSRQGHTEGWTSALDKLDQFVSSR